MKVILRLLGFLKPYLGEVLASILLGVATIAAGIGLLGTSAYLISSAALHPSIAELQVAIVGVRFFGISRAVFRYGERLVSHSVNLRLVSSLRSWYFEQMEKNDQKKLAIYRSGDLLDRALHNLESLEGFYVRVVSPFIVFSIVTLGVSLFVGHYQTILGWLLAGGLLTTGIILPIFSMIISLRPSRKAARQYSTLSAALIESMDGLEETTAHGSNNIVFERNVALSRELSSTNNRIAMQTGTSNALAVLVSNITILGLLWFSIPFIEDGLLTGIILAVVVQIAMASFEAANPLPAAAQHLAQGVTAGKNLFDLNLIANDKPDLPINYPVEGPVNLRLNKVDYRQKDGGFSLEDITFELPKGKKIALVGPSGAGKTSITDIILKFTQPDNGSILFDHSEYTSLSDEYVRSQFGVLSGGDYLFNSNLRDNLLLGKPDATEQELIDCMEKVGLFDWLSKLPQGMNTWLGNHGTSISGGEFQRLMLARLILQNRPFLILDEPLVNLDMTIKKGILNIILTEMPAMGLLWITHEYLFMEKMDEILYIENGRIIERGTHIELMEKNAKYAAAYSLQAI